jgi:hypothetical protein
MWLAGHNNKVPRVDAAAFYKGMGGTAEQQRQNNGTGILTKNPTP